MQFCFLTFLPKHQVSLARLSSHLAHVAPGRGNKQSLLSFSVLAVEFNAKVNLVKSSLPLLLVDLVALYFL